MDRNELKSIIKWSLFGHTQQHRLGFDEKEIKVVRKFALSYMIYKDLTEDQVVNVIYELLIKDGVIKEGVKTKASYIIGYLYEKFEGTVKIK